MIHRSELLSTLVLSFQPKPSGFDPARKSVARDTRASPCKQEERSSSAQPRVSIRNDRIFQPRLPVICGFWRRRRILLILSEVLLILSSRQSVPCQMQSRGTHLAKSFRNCSS